MRLVAVGDVSFGDHYFSLGHGPRSVLEGFDGYEIFSGFRNILSEADIAFCNLEGPVSDCNLDATRYDSLAFRGAPKSVCALKDGGFNVVNVANNHVLQHGIDSFRDTVNRLERSALNVLGLRSDGPVTTSPVFIEKDGCVVCMLGYSHVYDQYFPEQNIYSNGKLEDILRDIENVRSVADVVIVSLHYGSEATNCQSPADEFLARRIIDGGANIFIGHHSHIFHDLEIYNGGLIAYSLGNFVFDLLWDKRLRFSGVLDIVFSKEGIQSVCVHPIYIEKNAYPRLILASNNSSIFKKGLNFDSAGRVILNLKGGDRKVSIFNHRTPTLSEGLRKLIFFVSNVFRGNVRLKLNFLSGKLTSKISMLRSPG